MQNVLCYATKFVRAVGQLGWCGAIGLAGCSYTINGTLTSYNSPVTIYNNGAQAALVPPYPGASTTTFTITTTNSTYQISAQGPDGENCSVLPSSQGTNYSTVSIQVICYPLYISGTVSGWTPSTGPIYVGNYVTANLGNNITQGTNTVLPPINANGVFRFATFGTSNTLSLIPPPYPNTPNAAASCQLSNPVAIFNSTAATITNVEIYCATTPAPQTQQWKPLTKQPGAGVSPLILLSNGTIMASTSGSAWYLLTPDAFGSYVNGTWSTLPNSLCPHGQFASQVLHDGRVFVAGGELPGTGYITATPTCSVVSSQVGNGVATEIYDPSNSSSPWSAATPPTNLINPGAPSTPLGNTGGYWTFFTAQAFIDMTSVLLDDGRVLMAPVSPKNCGDTLLYDPAVGTGNWSLAATLANTHGDVYTCSEQETSWVKLRDSSVLTADPPYSTSADPPNSATDTITESSERFIASPTPYWFNDQMLPQFTLFNMEFGWSGHGEEGPAFLLPDTHGTAVFFGGDSLYATYTPGTPSPPGSGPVTGTWQSYPLPLNGAATQGATLAADDKPGAMMPNGKILLALNFTATQDDVFPSPVFFFEYDYTQVGQAGAFTEVAGPPGGDPNPWADCGVLPGWTTPTSYFNAMLVLPDGGVLMPSLCNQAQLYIYYSPNGSPLTLGQPTIDPGATTGPAPGWAVTRVTRSGNIFYVTGTGFTGISEGAAYGDDAQMASNYPLVRLRDPVGHIFYARTHDWTSANGLTPHSPGTTYFDVLPNTPPNTYSLEVVVNGNPSAPATFTWSCPTGYLWAGGACQLQGHTCTPNCAGKVCGNSNGCGGVCTTCPRQESCVNKPSIGYLCEEPPGGP